MMNRVSTYTRLLGLLADGKWHGRSDLRKITLYPDEWMEELRYAGHEVVENESGAVLVRFRFPDLPSAF
jgi:hypothetical protein